MRIKTCGQGLFDVLVQAETGQGYRWSGSKLGRLTKRSDQIVAIEARHFDIGNQQIRFLSNGEFYSTLGVGGRKDRVSQPFELRFHQKENVVGILNKKYTDGPDARFRML